MHRVGPRPSSASPSGTPQEECRVDSRLFFGLRAAAGAGGAEHRVCTALVKKKISDSGPSARIRLIQFPVPSLGTARVELIHWGYG